MAFLLYVSRSSSYKVVVDEDLTLIPHLTLITSLKTLFPNKVTFTDPRS